MLAAFSMSGLSTELLILGLLLVVNGFLAMAEIAIASARKARLRELADDGDQGARTALELGAEPARFLAAVQAGITFCAILAGALGGVALADHAAGWLTHYPLLAPWARYAAFGGVVVAITVLCIIFGELVPRRIALSNPERVARWVAGPLRALSRPLTPVLRVLGGVTNLLLKPFRLRTHRVVPVTDEEVNILIEQGLRAGVFHKAEKEMVEGVLGLDQLPVTAIMTPRPKIVFLNIGDSDEVNWRKIVASGHSYFPVYLDNRDQVLGMVAVKALWAHAAIGVPTGLKNLLTTPLVVPETMNCVQLLEAFKKAGQHTAMVADEFGSIQGMVTLIDVLEAIVGDLPAHDRRSPPEKHQREDGSWLMDATLPVNELKETLHVEELPQEDEAEYQTLGGLVMTQFGRIPAAGDRFEWNGWRFEVVDMDRHRVDKVLVSAVASAAATQKQAV